MYETSRTFVNLTAVWGAVRIKIPSYNDAWRVPEIRVDDFVVHSVRLAVPPVSKSRLTATRQAHLADASTIIWYNRHAAA